jgi:hypothetical protein
MKVKLITMATISILFSVRLPHLSPLSWEHIYLTADYVRQANRRVVKDRFRPLRQSVPVLADA